MTSQQNIIIIEDDSVSKKIKKTAKKLKKKYTSTRAVDEKFLKETPLWRKIVSHIMNALMTLLVLFSCSLVVALSASKINHTTPTYAGCSVLTIVSGSMVDAGFDVGDTIVVNSVKTHTLNVGDKIAFYVSASDFHRFNISKSHIIETIQKTKANLTFANFFGFQSQKISQACKAGSQLVFHEIVKIYEDENGEWWFKTKGASNPTEDSWIISETLVLGILNQSGSARFFASIFSFMFNNIFLLVILLLVPLMILLANLGLDVLRCIYRIKLECDVVEEKRKLTDEICVKHNVGYYMDKQTKLKVLAQAEPHEKEQYIALLWKDGNAPNSIRKYYIRKNLLLEYNRQMLDLNRLCEQKMKDGEELHNIAKLYDREKSKIQKQLETKTQRLKQLRKAYNKKG